MVSPGVLRAVVELRDGESEAFEPSIDSAGRISYPDLEAHLDGREDDPVAVLERLTDRGAFDSRFVSKAYVCPDCDTEGMQYVTACPACESVHVVREEAVVHPSCGSILDVAPEDVGDGVPCRTCDETVERKWLDRRRRHRCHGCDSWIDEPEHRLRCRRCEATCPPEESRELPLYRYPMAGTGERWLDRQLEARRSLAEALEARRYETELDATVSGNHVHLLAEDSLFDDRLVVDVHDGPTEDDLRQLVGTAAAVDARPVVLSTGESLGEGAIELIDAEGVTVLTVTDDGLSRASIDVDRPAGTDSLLDRVVSAIGSPER